MQLPKTVVFTRNPTFHGPDKKEDNNPSRTPAYLPLHLDKYADKPQKQSSEVQHHKINQQKRPLDKLPLVQVSTVLQDSVKKSTQKSTKLNEGKKKLNNLAENIYTLTKPTNKPLKTVATFTSLSQLKRKHQQNLVALPLPQEEYQYIDFSPSLPSSTSPSPSFLCPSPLPSRRSFPSNCHGRSDACWVPVSIGRNHGFFELPIVFRESLISAVQTLASAALTDVPTPASAQPTPQNLLWNHPITCLRRTCCPRLRFQPQNGTR